MSTDNDPHDDADDVSHGDILHMASEIVAGYVGNNPVKQGDVPGLITTVYETLSGLGGGNGRSAPQPPPAVPIKKSVMPDYVVCLEDGKKLKMLKRYLRSTYGLSPDAYRAKWNLPADYPMVAPNYAKRRSEFAKQSGLGKGKKTKE